jgi:hypothetical protein
MRIKRNMLGDIRANISKYLELGAFLAIYQFFIALKFALVSRPILFIEEGVSPKSSRRASAMILAS